MKNAIIHKIFKMNFQNNASTYQFTYQFSTEIQQERISASSALLRGICVFAIPPHRVKIEKLFERGYVCRFFCLLL